jgi:alpha-D-xyloside xylohydrolase
MIQYQAIKRFNTFANNKLIFGLLAATFLLASCGQQPYKKVGNGIIVPLAEPLANGAKQVKLEVVSDQIIRVSATPEANFPNRKSLVVLPQPSRKVAFNVDDLGETIQVSTQKINAFVVKKTGSVSFTDKEGNALLREHNGGAKTFNPIAVDGTSGYSFRQVFESPDDEAFFGLGQHQSDEWNYKGKNEILYQYNTKVSVPFVVSNKKYGLLWDNYSLTKFGDVRDYEPLSQFKLYNKNGEPGGLTAKYITSKGKLFADRNEAAIDYEDLEQVKNFPKDFPFNDSQIVWEGEIEAKESGTFQFKLYYAGYTTLTLNNTEVVPERWRTAWNPNTYKFSFALEAGKKVPIRLEWKPDGGISYIGLKALSPLPEEEKGQLAIWSEMGQELDYYFVYGETIDKIISGYRTLTGKAPIMPQWAYGFWQSRERYKTQDEIVSALTEFRRRKIPIDNIVMDWSYWEVDQWGSHEFEASRFPDPKQMVDDIHNMHAHLMISVWPKFYINTQHYKEFDEKGWMYKQAVNDSIRDWISPGYIGSFYDPYSQGARKLFWNQLNDHLYPLGIDAWWMDASEPDILSNASLDYRKKLSGPNAMGSSTEFLNTYALLNAQGIFYGQRSVDPNKRVFLLTRSGFAGLQRYSTATWSGDIGTRWEDMKAQISAGLNFALSGIPYWTMDIGGFCVEKRYEQAKEGSEDLNEWRELNTRWYQFGAFAPLFRAHGQFPFREVYHIAPEDHPAYQSIVYYNKLRYRLMPYIYSLAGKVYFDDYTLMRALVMDFGNDPKALNISDQYLFGPSLMVCPVYQYKARSRQVYFPESAGWYNIYNGAFIRSAQTTRVDAPYEQIPLFVRAGSIIPVGPEIQYVGEKPGEAITLYVYGGADAEFVLYEDEGLNYNYESGAYSKITLNYYEESKTLVLGEREGAYRGMDEERNFNIVFINKTKPGILNPSTKPDKTISYKGKPLSIKL